MSRRRTSRERWRYEPTLPSLPHAPAPCAHRGRPGVLVIPAVNAPVINGKIGGQIVAPLHCVNSQGHDTGNVRFPMRPQLTPVQRFWSKIDLNGPVPTFKPSLGRCWFWTGIKRPLGYGRFQAVASSRNHLVSAPKFALEVILGRPLLPGMVPDHLCRVPICVRPSHLEEVTRRENTRRGIKGVLTTHCPRKHPYDVVNTRWYRGSRYCRACETWAARHGGGDAGHAGRTTGERVGVGS